MRDTIGLLSIIIQLIFLEGILSIDNAAVLGAMVSVLPSDRPVPYPRALHLLQRFTDRVLGMQQSAALKVGLIGAYCGRGLMLVMATWVIENPVLKLIGAAYLIKLAFDQLSHAHGPEAETAIGDEAIISRNVSRVSFWMVVLNVELADLAFSLDNVVAAVALSDRLWVVMAGVALGIITMRFAASVFTWLIKREPILATAAYIVVLNIGVELVLAEVLHIHFESWQKFSISAATLLLCVGYAHFPLLHFLDPAFHWLRQGMGIINDLVSWVIAPVTAALRIVFRAIASAVSPLAAAVARRAPAVREYGKKHTPEVATVPVGSHREA